MVVFVYYLLQSITYGQSLGIHCAGIDAILPLNIVDSILTARAKKIPEEEDQPTISTNFSLALRILNTQEQVAQ